MELPYMRCKCNQFMTEDDFTRHFQRCDEFRKGFRQFDTQFGELLRLYSDPKENLMIIRVLLKQYITVLDNKIKTHFPNGLQIPIPDVQPGNGKLPQPEKEINSKSTVQLPSQPHPEPKPIVVVEMGCQLCKGPDCQYLDCLHFICLNCFKEYAEKDFPHMKCQECGVLIPEYYKMQILGKEEYERLDIKFGMGGIENVVECPQCKEKSLFEKGTVDYNIKNDKNEKLSKEAAEHYAEHRCRCPSCKIDFCSECKSTPYHIGKTCEAYIRFVTAKKCRFDDTVITSKNRGPADNVCSNSDCVANYQISCKKKLKCGHNCFGCVTETKCPPCLDKDCPNFVNIYDQNGDSYCNICFSEGLSNSPVILLSCNHYVHYKCIDILLKKKWIGPKITFNHMLCPHCKNWVDCPTVTDIQAMVAVNKALYEAICKMALERLKFEGLNKEPKLTTQGSKWYKDELGYALHRISYYMCYECKKPYFAGLRECGDGPVVNNNNNNNVNNPNSEYDPKDLICGAHANIAGVAGTADCPIHGKEFIEYKCKFCCNIASWFCWNTTHFCEDCHTKQCKGDYVSKCPKDKLPKCDKQKCQVKVDHPPNGDEFALGCSVCRNNSANIKNF